ncbi:MAG: phenylalanine--tRNA ligase subunit beta [Deltaproteobacteria bacterium]
MKVTYNWLKEFLDLKAAPQELAEKLTMTGLSVAALERAGDDWVYDIEVTSNRPDWLSVVGIAHEVAAATGARFKRQVPGPQPVAHGMKGEKTAAGGGPQFTISIEDPQGCGLYCGNLIAGVRVGPSPAWLAQRLAAVGVRSVNNVVDITNFILLQYGQPLHAFDFDRLAGLAIVVRRARRGEEIALIDGSQKKLTPEVLLICDADRPVAAAGIMGGSATEVTGATRRVLLESACFDPVVVRRGTRVLGVASDSSYRFERGVDVATVTAARDAATRMIVALCGGALLAARTAGSQKPAPCRKITVSLAEAGSILSLPIGATEATGIFRRLGFAVRRMRKGQLAVTVPALRRDVQIKEDLIEELARIRGYDAIPLTDAAIKPFVYEPPAIDALEASVQDYLVRSGLKETVTYSLVGDDDYLRTSLEVPPDAARLANPPSQDYRVLRTTLIPSLLSVAALNISRGNTDLELFETARVYAPKGELRCATLLLAGSRRATWVRRSRRYEFFDVKGIVEGLAAFLGIEGGAWLPSTSPVFAPKEAVFFSASGILIAELGRVEEKVLRQWGIKGREPVFAAEFYLDKVLRVARPQARFRPFETLPSVRRDVSLTAGPQAPFDRIRELILREARGFVREVALADTYEGKEIPADRTGLTLCVTYADPGRTLTDEEVNRVHQGVLDRLVADLGVALR